ncbi:MAG: GxxExxY protein [Candidatus Methanoperedenaceae archaeon]|nr:GxxExxY protein [Candidatus Methanoperedenaceae archaeon]
MSTEKIIGCAIEAHRNLGHGLLESIYEKALCYEFTVNIYHQPRFARYRKVFIYFFVKCIGIFALPYRSICFYFCSVK